ncbi:MAG: hypothetical protein ACE367_09940 [Acidimicrobiales bacterium]
MSPDLLVFTIVVLLRLGVPLLIPRFPVPAIVFCLVIDAADQTIFQQYTDLNLDSYQSYDKALDIYYLTIAYLAVIRNWTDPFALRTAQFLWYYRLVGVLVFETTGARFVLLLFPNTFEYFFIAYEAVRMRWNPDRLRERQVLAMAAFIWVFIKLPQEWWIHVAQNDFTDFMKEDVFGVSADASWGSAIGENLWFVVLMGVAAAGAVVAVRSVRPKLPPPDWGFTIDVDRTIDRVRVVAPPEPAWHPVLSWYMTEKVLLVSAVTAIFAMVIPNNEVSVLGVIGPVAFVILFNSFAGSFVNRRGHTAASIWAAAAFSWVVNLVAALVFIWLVRNADERINEFALLFYVTLLTLIVALFDWFHRRGPAAALRRDADGQVTAAAA